MKQWVQCICGIRLTGETTVLGETPVTHLTWTGPGLEPDLRCWLSPNIKMQQAGGRYRVTKTFANSWQGSNQHHSAGCCGTVFLFLAAYSPPPTPCPNTVSSPFYVSVLPFHHSLVPPTRALVNVLWNSVPWFGNNEPETPIGTSEGVIGPQQFAHLRVIRCCSPQFPHPATPTSRFKALRQL